MTGLICHTDETEWPARMAIIEARAQALAALWDRQRSSVDATPPGP